jgi:hypothetical protein
MMLKKWRYRLIAGGLKENKMKKLKESAMAELDIAAQEAPTFEAFVKTVKQEFPQLASDLNKPEVISFLQNMYDDAKMRENKKTIKKSQLEQLIREEIKRVINEAVDPDNWPIGYFEVKSTFEISPGGGWAVKFNKGLILQIAQSKVDRSLQTITYWDALKDEWVVKAPPISGYKDNGGMFPIKNFSDSRGWTTTFAQNTTPLSDSAAAAKAKSSAAETTLTAKEALKMLSTMPPNQMLKITIVK